LPWRFVALRKVIMQIDPRGKVVIGIRRGAGSPPPVGFGGGAFEPKLL